MRSAPCLVRENTSTDSSAASFSRCTSAGTFAAIDTSTTHCVTASAGRRARADLDQHRRLQELLRDRLDLLRHRRGEEQRLARLRRRRDDAADRRQEAHVEHAIGFVEHQHLQRVEIHVALLHQVDQAAGRGDDDVDAAAQRLDLRAFTDAAEDRGVAQAAGAARRRACSPRSATTSSRVGAITSTRMRRSGCAIREPLEQRQHERRGLAGAGLRHADHVAAGENDRDRLRLDRRRLDVALFRERLRELRAEAECGERQLRALGLFP